MQCASFLPGCYSSRDLDAGSNVVTWPLNNNDIPLTSGRSYNVLLPPTEDQFVRSDKEVLRQTMLKHESIFRDQVRELHRLYGRQRELLDEIKRGLSEPNLQFQTSQSNYFLSKISSEYALRTWKTPSLHGVNPAANRLSISSSENIRSASSIPEDSLKDCKLLQFRSEKPKRKMLDLEIPADEHRDNEEEDQFGVGNFSEVPEASYYLPKRMSEVSQASDLKLFPCGGLVNSNICEKGFCRPNSFSRNADDLADLNEPFRLDNAMASDSVNLLGYDSKRNGIQCQDLEPSGKSNSGLQVLTKEIVSYIQTGRDGQACLKSVYQNDRQQELLPRNDEAGQSKGNLNSLHQVYTSGTLPMSSKLLKVEHPVEFLMDPLDECDIKLRNQRKFFCRETLERNHDLSYDDYAHTSSQLIPHSDGAKSEPSAFSSRKRPIYNFRQNPIAVQALPCFEVSRPYSKGTKSSLMRPLLKENKFHSSRNLRSNPGVIKVCPLENSFFIGSESEYRTDACLPLIDFNYLNYSSANGSPPEVHSNCFQRTDGRNVNSVIMDLNLPPSCLLDSEISKQNVGTQDRVKKLEDSLAVFPCPRAKPYYSNEPGKVRQDISQTDLALSQAFPTSVFDAKTKRLKTTDCPGNEKILASSNFEKPRVSTDQFFTLTSTSNFHSEASEDKGIKHNQKAGVLEINLANQHVHCTTNNLSLDVIVDSKRLEDGNQIDLNSCINEDESSPTPSIPRVIVKTVTEIDLEAPVSPENKECSPPRGESEANQLDTPMHLSKQEERDLKDELIKMAAETIVLISTPGFQKLSLEKTVCETMEASLIESQSLQWFAGIVSSVAGDLENEVRVVLSSKDGVDQQELLSDGSDYFEAMTLELTEMKVEEYWCKNNGQKDEEKSTVSSLSQPRRGRTRKGRQRKDFQTQVLPSLSSLSRHEVTKDLQIIGGLMERAGFLLESSLGGRNVGRNRCSRARKVSSQSFCRGMENKTCLLLKLHNNDSELGFGKRSLKGWGEKNRRRRGPRIRASNPPLIHT